jgi:uncharacterized protein (DUF58 family)
VKPTKEGKRFILATLLIVMAAVNTGNNLIYLILAMMFSILLIAVVVLSLNLKNLIPSISVVQPVFAKSRSILKVSLLNRKMSIPSYSIHINPPDGIKGHSIIPHVISSSQVSVDMDVVFEKRGIYSFGDFSLESSFPFILFNKKIRSHVGGDITVYPEIKEVDGLIPDLISSEYDSTVVRRGPGEEFMMIREFRYGDSIRKIQWKTSAKSGKLMVKETGIDEPRLFTIILDNIKPLDKDSFEKAVSFAASLAERFIRIGFFVRLITCKKLIPFGSGTEHLFKILDVLALIGEEDTWECPMMHEMQGTGVLILKSADSSLIKAVPMCSMVVYAADL